MDGGGEGGWENHLVFLSQGSIQKEVAGLTSDLWQLFPQALPATASPLTVPDTPQPSGQGKQTKDLQGTDMEKSHRAQGGIRERESTTRTPTDPLTQVKADEILLSTSDSWPKENTNEFSIYNLLPRGLG